MPCSSTPSSFWQPSPMWHQQATFTDIIATTAALKTIQLSNVETKPNRDHDLDILAKYICTPCSSASKRDEPDALLNPPNDLPTLYSELQTLRSETINRMTAAGLTPSKRSRFALVSRGTVPDAVEVPAKEFDILSAYVCPDNCIAKWETRFTVNTKATTNININVPAEQLQGVLNAINQALKQVEALLCSSGLPIPEGSFPTIPRPGSLSQPAPIEPQEPAQPVPDAPQPTSPAPEPTPAPEAPSPTISRSSMSTNTRTVTATNGVVTTIVVTEEVAPRPAPAPTQGPGGNNGNGGEGCTATVTVENTTTVYSKGGEDTAV